MTEEQPPRLDRWLLFPGLAILAGVAIPGTMSDDPVLRALSWLGILAAIGELGVFLWRRRTHRAVNRDA